MFTHHAELLHELLEKFPVNVNDCHILMINPEAYHNWLETYSVEGCGSAGTNKRLKYAKEQQQQDADYRRVLDNIEKWISIPTHSFAAQSILISGYQDVFVDFHPEFRYRGDFFLRLCLEHVKNEAWLFAEGLGHRTPQDTLTYAIEKTKGFLSRVSIVLDRLRDDWTPTGIQLFHLDFKSLQIELSYLLLHKEWCLWMRGCEQALKDVYEHLLVLVDHLPTPTIMWAWNTAVSLMTVPVGKDKETGFKAFIASLNAALESENKTQDKIKRIRLWEE